MAPALEGLTVAELKDLLREQGLPVSGKKSVLIERLEEYNLEEMEEQIEDKIVFNCNNCKSKLRIAQSFRGEFKCPTCSTKQSTAEIDNTSGPISIDITQNQISLTISIVGMVLGVLAIGVFFSAFSMDSMCPEEYRTTVMYEGEEAMSCDSDQMLWETGTAKRIFYSCCLMVPGSLFLTIMGYNLRKEQSAIGTATSEKEATTNPNNFSESKVAKAIQAAAISFGIGISTISAILVIAVIVLFVILIIVLLSSGGGAFFGG